MPIKYVLIVSPTFGPKGLAGYVGDMYDTPICGILLIISQSRLIF